MKCSAVLLLIYAFCVIGSKVVPQRNRPSLLIHNVKNGVERLVELDGNLKLSEARHILNMSSTDIFFEYRFGNTIHGHVGQVVQIPSAAEQYKTLGEIKLRNGISIWCKRCFKRKKLGNGSQQLKINSTTPNSTPGGEVQKQLTTNGPQIEDSLVMKNDSGRSGVTQFPPSYITSSTPRVPHQNGVHSSSFGPGDIFKHLKGLKVDSRGELVSTNYTVADLKRHPIIKNIDQADFHSSSTFDLKEFKMKFGITDNSSRSDGILSYSAHRPDNYGGQHTTYRPPYPSHSITSYGGQHTTYRPPYPSQSIARDAVEKQEIEMAENDLIINTEFYNDIQNALLPGRLELENALKLLEVLQKYGWFVPLHFTTGGCSYDTDITEVRDSEQAETGSTTPLISVNSEASSAEHTEMDQNSSRTMFENGSPPMPTRDDSLNQTPSKPVEWKIVKYKRLLPTLMLLYRYNNWTLSQSLKLLSEFRVQLQPKEAHIDILTYTLATQQILY